MPNQRSDSKVPPRQVPASHLQKHIKEPYQSSWPTGGTPWGGGTFLPHIFTVAGRYGVASKAYSVGDEALIDSRENAEMMRNELAIMECLEARMRSTALLNWHIGPRDETLDQRTKAALAKSGFGQSNKWQADELAAKVSLILARTPHLTKLFYSLMDAIWYGRYATEQFWQPTSIQGLSNRAMIIKRWEPRHGDKIIFRYDDGTQEYDPEQIGIRIGPGYKMQQEFRDYGGNLHKKVEATQFGLAYFLDGAERKKYALHKHIIEDGDFNRPIKAGNLHGVGIRSRIYWSWYAYTESLKLLMEYLERSALGIEIWRYPAHNPQAKSDAAEAAQRRGAPGRSILMVPVPEGEAAAMYDVEIVEPGLQGADVLQNVLQTFFGHKIKRYILGQTLTTEADATGMGSGMADLHAATYSDIVRFDSLGLAETITQDIVRQIQLLNFPGSEGIHLQFRFDTESPMMQMKLDAYRQLWEMGAKVKTDDLFKTIGASRPTASDETLLNPAYFEMEQMQQQQGMAPAMDLGAMQMPEGEEQAGDAEMAQDMLMPAMMDQFSTEPIMQMQPRYSQPIQMPEEETVETDVMRFAAEMCAKHGNENWQAYVDRYQQGGFDFDKSESASGGAGESNSGPTKGFQENFGFADEAERNSKGEVQSGLFGNEYKAAGYTKKDKDILPAGFFEAQESAPMTPRKTKAPLRPAPKGMFDETMIPETAQKSAKEVFLEGMPAGDREALSSLGYTEEDYWNAIQSGDRELIKKIARLLPSTAPTVESAKTNAPPQDGMLFSVMNQMILRYATQGSFDFDANESQVQKKSPNLASDTSGSNESHPHSSMVNHEGPTKLTLIPCTGGKNEGTHKAKDLYKGDNFTKHRKYAEASGNPWAIVSAKHHILDPDEMVSNYDTPMPKRKNEQQQWGEQLKPKLINHLKRLGINPEHGVEIETLAGNDYNSPMKSALLGHEQIKGINAPMQGLGQGRKKTWMVNEFKLKELESKRNEDEETLEDLAIEGYDRDVWRKLAPHIDEAALEAIHDNPSYTGDSVVLGGIPLDLEIDELYHGSPLYMAFREQEDMGIGVNGEELRPGSETLAGGNYEPDEINDRGLDEYVKNHYPNEPHEGANWNAAGYVFADGSLNDMSHGQGERADDHRSVVPSEKALAQWGFDKHQVDNRTLAMNELMRRTNMARIHIGGGESGTDLQLHIEAPLTSSQKKALTYYVKNYRPENVYYDIGGGFGYAEDDKSGEIDNPRSFNDVLNHMEGLRDEDEYDLDQYSAGSHDESAISTANATSRSGGAVGGHPVTIKYVRQLAKRKVPILDFGAGKAAAQAKELNKMGYNVVPYDYGNNAIGGVHDPSALDREYPFVYASNVLNVQNSIEELKTTIQEIAESLAVGGTFIGNLPASPRKAAFDGMSQSEGADLVKKLLQTSVGNVRIEESPSHPVFIVTKGQRQRYATMVAERYEAKMPTRSAKMGVGKQIGNAVYVHRQYTGTTPEAERVKQAARCAGSFAWDIAKITPDAISLIKSPDFDQSEEPISGDSLVVRNDGSTRLIQQQADPNIYHHKWLMVGDDYTGFDTEQSKQRSSKWINLPVDKSKIGKLSYWKKHVIPIIDKCSEA